MRLVVGLGNPGPRFRKTRHNVGFMVADELASRWAATDGRVECDAWVCEARLGDETVVVAKPLSFMNRSGAVVEALLLAREHTARDLVVVLDDLVLDLGGLRVREKGSHGGHNGLRSIIDVLGTEDFARVRVGIRKGEVPADLADFVLSEFPAEDVLVVQEMVGTAADAVECILREGLAPAMNRFNSTPRA
jgi:PTH1 family peptidyl-tRNA hydrolase